MTKRNKKYNPNKLIQIKQSKLANIYEFDMQFVIEEVNEKIDAWREDHNMPEDVYCPEFLVIDAYAEQDLIIALKMQQLKDPVYWNIGIDSHFYSIEKEDIYTIPFSIDLPQMSHAELMNGCAVIVSRGAGIKTRWKGLQKEMLAHWEKEGIPEGYELIKSQVYIKAQAKFKSFQMLDEHNYMLKLRDQGTLIKHLKMWNDEQRGTSVAEARARKGVGV